MENTNTNPLNTTTETQPTVKRKYRRHLVEFPTNRSFTPAGLAQELGVETFVINNAIKKHRNKLEVVGTEPSKRGKKKPVYKLI